MLSAARHVGTSGTCPVCLLQKDQFSRRETGWLHALALFVDQSGVDPSSLGRDDLALLVRTWSRANALARIDRALFVEATSPRRPSERFDPRTARVAVFLMLAVLVCLGIICSGVWRFLS